MRRLIFGAILACLSLIVLAGCGAKEESAATQKQAQEDLTKSPDIQ